MEGKAVKNMRLKVPDEIGGIVKVYQTNYKNRYQERMTKEQLILKLIDYGRKAFEEESKKMETEYIEFNNK